MSRYRLELASPADDADLRAVLAATPMPGRIALTFRREPSFFASMAQEAEFFQVIACRDTETGRIVGFGTRSVSRRYVNGEPIGVGYLSSLRLLREHRNLGLIARGYQMLRELHEDGRAAFYLTTIADGNDVATRVLTSGRAGLPTYEPFGRYVTMAFSPTGGRGGLCSMGRAQRVPPGTVTAHDGTRSNNLLARHGPHRQFFPCDNPPMNRLWLASEGDVVTGCLGTWDQSGSRQTVVEGYAGWLRRLRPVYNAWARLRGAPPLPAPGEPVRYLTAATPVAADAATFGGLLAAASRSVPAGHFLMLGLHERDPLLAAVRRLAAAEYVTQMYLVYWDSRPALDDRPPYLELGCL